MKRKILIVEDNIMLVGQQKKRLEKSGYEAEITIDEPGARKLLKKESFDLVLSDVRLPEGDGISLLEWMRKERMDIPFIIMTGYASVPDAVQAIKLGAKDYLAKPVQMDELQRQLKDIFRPKSVICDKNKDLLPRNSLQMQEVEHLVSTVAPFDISVLILGPNGAGKSTILKSITRQLATISGTVYLDKEKMAKMTNKEVSQKLAVVLTERMRPELMTCEDIVATGRYPYTGTLGILSAEDKTKVKKSMETVHAWDLKDRDFTAISDGQRQRILLARAICQEPEIIVLDEPTSFLDIRHKLELLTILKQMVLDHQLTVIMSLHELDLAQKISDKVICVHGEYIEKYGAPEEIFTSEYIRKLYGITRGSYNAAFGCVEMDPPRGEPQVFVIGGNGSGIPYYRKLQRQGIPFAAGVLHTNDVDCQVAGALADQVITEKPFESISQESYDKAVKLMKKCQKVICPLKDFGTVNAANRELLRLARELGILAEL